MRGEFSRRSLLRAGALAGLGFAATTAKATPGNRPDRQIVGTADPAATRAAERRADAVERVLDFGDVGQAVAGRFPEKAIEALRKRADVRYVERDGAVEALGETLPWGIDRVDADVVHADGETGSGADVAIVDTGIDSDHPDLQANLGTGYAVETCNSSVAECNHAWDDDNGHGSHCAGIADAVDNSRGVVGVSTDATLHAVKVLDDWGGGSISGVAEGIKWVADQGYDVGSLSLGTDSSYQTLKDACQYAHDAGVVLVAAAGNNGPCSDCVGYPAAYSTVVAVSATASDDSLADYSSTGPEVELAAPGTDVYSTFYGGGYDTLSGTSMACPHVSGAAGQLVANGYSQSEVRQRLKDTAEDVGLGSNEQGSGLLDVEAALADSSGGDTSVVATTDGASDVGVTSATLDGSLTDLGGASSADVYFQYRESGTSTWSSTGATTLSSTGSFSDSISGLAEDTAYDFRAVAEASNGDSDTGSTLTVTTTNDPVVVSTGSATDVTENGATLSGSLDDLGGADSANVSFEWRAVGSSSYYSTTSTTLSSTGSFSKSVTGLSTGTDYEFRAVAEASDGDAATGSLVGFTTDGSSTGDTAPAIDSYAASEAGSPNPHAEITADWAVSDADGDLDSVLVEVIDGSGSVVDSARTSVGDSSASGSDSFEIKHAGRSTFDVRLTVTDGKGNTASQTKTVTS